MTAIHLLSTDLMDRSKFPADTVVVGFADQLDGAADVVVVDVMRPDAIEGVRRLRAEGSHRPHRRLRPPRRPRPPRRGP